MYVYATVRFTSGSTVLNSEFLTVQKKPLIFESYIWVELFTMKWKSFIFWCLALFSLELAKIRKYDRNRKHQNPKVPHRKLTRHDSSAMSLVALWYSVFFAFRTTNLVYLTWKTFNLFNKIWTVVRNIIITAINKKNDTSLRATYVLWPVQILSWSGFSTDHSLTDPWLKISEVFNQGRIV